MLTAAGLLCLLWAAASATVGTRSGAPTCPPGGFTTSKVPGRCLVPTDPPDGPSSVDTVAPTRDLRLPRRIGILGVGIAVALILAVSGMRLASRDEASFERRPAAD